MQKQLDKLKSEESKLKYRIKFLKEGIDSQQSDSKSTLPLSSTPIFNNINVNSEQLLNNNLMDIPTLIRTTLNSTNIENSLTLAKQNNINHATELVPALKSLEASNVIHLEWNDHQ